MKNKGMKLLLLAMTVAGLAGAAPIGVLADTTDEGVTSEAAIQETAETRLRRQRRHTASGSYKCARSGPQTAS